MIKEVVKQLETDEGYRAMPYKDTLDNWTFGHGLTYITPEESLLIVTKRVEELHQRLKLNMWYRRLNEQRQQVILNMAYNLGYSGLLTFNKMISAIKRGDFDRAANEILNSRYAKQVGARADRLAERMRA